MPAYIKLKSIVVKQWDAKKVMRKFTFMLQLHMPIREAIIQQTLYTIYRNIKQMQRFGKKESKGRVVEKKKKRQEVKVKDKKKTKK